MNPEARSADPTDPIDATEPIDPIESSEPRHPMHSVESCDHSDHFEAMPLRSGPGRGDGPACSTRATARGASKSGAHFTEIPGTR